MNTNFDQYRDSSDEMSETPKNFDEEMQDICQKCNEEELQHLEQYLAKLNTQQQEELKNFLVSLPIITIKDFIENVEGYIEKEAITSTGAGGQHVNRNKTGMRLTFLPLEYAKEATERREQKANKRNAYNRLFEELQEKFTPNIERIAGMTQEVKEEADDKRIFNKKRRGDVKAQRRINAQNYEE